MRVKELKILIKRVCFVAIALKNYFDLIVCTQYVSIMERNVMEVYLKSEHLHYFLPIENTIILYEMK